MTLLTNALRHVLGWVLLATAFVLAWISQRLIHGAAWLMDEERWFKEVLGKMEERDGHD